MDDKVESFIKLFHTNKEKIIAFDGCQSVDLLRDVNDKNIFFTYSIWDSESFLNHYRQSETFGLKQNLYFVIKQKLGALKRFNIFAIVCMHFLKKK